MSPRGEFACRFGTYVTRLTVWARSSAGIAAGGGLGWAGGCCVRGRRRTIAIVAEWWSIEVLHGDVSAFRWQEQHDSALIEAALTNGVRDGTWHADRWGVVFEVLFDTEDRWEAFRGLPVVRAALDAVPDPVNGLLIYRGRGGGAGTREPRRPKPAPGSAAVSLPGPADEPYLDLAAVSAPAAQPTTAGALVQVAGRPYQSGRSATPSICPEN